ncbi:DUF4097 family beta strand repeat protein [Paenibacillus sp. GSMTC-2017]|uniref:DUF4097 family beta strand repeat-containing protein n=1 Tax=Paenibacillus sp. GSMTC-2017 TaxID=2794350 RepID=UPI0018D7AF57|nr:DUF4097 family beta strand repeat-containing protein [Paenibacillus sp. GSMTC-2017]MBH5318043.1 DUF4097 family beta strand repeat protein [Paenibacillus sp. GSMTC-2017]
MKSNKWILVVIICCLSVVIYITSQVGSKKFEIKEQFPVVEVQKIEITNGSWNIEVKESKDNKVHVVVFGKQKDKTKVPVVVANRDKTLTIEQHKQIGGALSAFTFAKEGTISILIPKDTVDQVDIINKDGDLLIQSLATEKLSIDNKMGYIKMDQVKADLNVTSINGEIVLKRANDNRHITIETVTGDVQVDFLTTPSSLNVEIQNNKGDTNVSLANLLTTVKTNKSISGMIGAGEKNLSVKSKSGTIVIK